MYPKLFWDSRGIERKAHTPEDEAKAVAAGWSEVPPGPGVPLAERKSDLPEAEADPVMVDPNASVTPQD